MQNNKSTNKWCSECLFQPETFSLLFSDTFTETRKIQRAVLDDFSF